MRILVGVLICSAGALAQQVERGDTLYQQQCAGCHALKGKGTAVGPDLNGMARLTSQAIAMAVRSTATQYVQSVKLKAGDTIVGMPGPKDDKTVSFWDLGKKPPELRKMDKGDVAASTNTDAWK